MDPVKGPGKQIQSRRFGFLTHENLLLFIGQHQEKKHILISY